jgi:hygromycin-B 7''-O-kinase
MKLPGRDEFESEFRSGVWDAAAREICRRHAISFENLRRADHGENVVFLAGERHIVKIYTPKKSGFSRERSALETLGGRTSLRIPELVGAGEIGGYDYLVTTLIPGRLMTREEWLSLKAPARFGLIGELAAGLKQLHSLDAGPAIVSWGEFLPHQAETALERQKAEGGNPEWITSLPKYLDENLYLLADKPANAFIHGDVHFGNLRVADHLTVGGLFDFADCLSGFFEYEFVAVGVLMIQGQRDEQREFLRAYGYRDREIDDELRRRLMLLTILYEHSSLKRYAARLGPGSENLTLLELERAIWNFQ